MAHIPETTLYLVGTDKQDAWQNTILPFDEVDNAEAFAQDNGLSVFAATFFGPQSYEELEEIV